MSVRLHNRRHVIIAGLACIVTTSLPLYAAAHRQRRALTTIVWNSHTKLLEITHALHLHDAEQALARLGNLQKPDLTPLRARAQLAIYTQTQFHLKNLHGENVQTTILGAEIDSGYAYVYLEAKMAQMPKGLLITDTILQDIFIDQVNVVNLDLGDGVKTATFLQGDTPKKLLA